MVSLDPHPGAERVNSGRLALQTLIISVVVLAAICAVMLISAAFDVFLLLFAGILIAVLLSGLSRRLEARTGLGYRWSFLMVLAILLLGLGLLGWSQSSGIADQIAELRRKLPEAIQRLQALLEQRPWTRAILDTVHAESQKLSQAPDIWQRATGIFSNALGVLTGLVMVFIVGLFLAIEPEVYRAGIVHLIPLRRRPRAQEILDALNENLWWWLVATFGSMTAIGILTFIGLWALGIPLAFTLALLAALLTFIPNFGPILSAVPAILLGFLVSPTQALWVVLLYVSVQIVESNLITPLIQQRTLSIPPVLIIAAQLLMGVWAGVIGLIVATPLTVVLFLLVKQLYVKDTLGDTVDERP